MFGKCYSCGLVKNETTRDKFGFSKHRKGGFSAYCKNCTNKNSRKNYQKPHRKLYRKYHHLKKTYSLSYLDYTKMLVQQDFKCKACGKYDKTQDLSVDHCHDTGNIRGLLCIRCNLISGAGKKHIERIECILSYLKEYYK